MKKQLRSWMLLVLVALGMASCVENLDNPVVTPVPEPESPETPQQEAFWKPFDAWQTDSCTVGDDFFMHMLGTWWKNPVDIYPGGLMGYAAGLNEQRVRQIRSDNPDMTLLIEHATKGMTMTEDEVELMMKAKVEELWAGATTREEALEALGRAWAEGYTLMFEPAVALIDGVPTWQLTLKVPSYLNDSQVFNNKQEEWQLRAPRHNSRLLSRGDQVASDIDHIVKGVNVGVDHMGIDEDVEDSFMEKLEKDWNTIEGIRAEIEQAVTLLDGALVNDDCVNYYNQYLPTILSFYKTKVMPELTKIDIYEYVAKYLMSLYVLNDYNEKYITPAMRKQYGDWCERFRETMRLRLEANTWLESQTRQNAIDKLDKVVFYVGGISEIPDCVIPTLTGETILDDVRQLRKARFEGLRWAITQPRSNCAMLLSNLTFITDPTDDNASYMTDRNVVCINPSNLLSPYVEEDYEDALQWAYLGTTIGHELTHGFDSNGAKYDQWGQRNDWWTEADAAKFDKLCGQLVDQYNHLQLMPWADPTLYGDGETTLTENIADLGGCCIALQILLDQHPQATDAEKRALARRFFQGWAIQWSRVYGPKQVEMMATDVHSMPRERTNGIVRNVDAWYDAYDIHSGALYLQPSERVIIW